MTNSNPFEAYVSPHLMPSVGLASRGDGGQRQQLWDSDATSSPASNFLSPHPSLFTSVSASNSTFYADIPFASTAAGRGGDGGGYQLYPTIGAEYTAAQGLIKSEDGVYGQSIGLNLGHRTYFPMVRQNTPRCQAEGCMADLSAAKHYHRRHKVCEYHSKATVVVAVGLQQRFCQQCSRFHVLSEFDENKRSCRKRLADHNRRRRKPRTLPLASTTAGNRSVHPSSNSTEKKKEASTKSTTKGTAAAKDAVANTSTSFSTISTTNQTNMSAASPKEYQKKASPLRHGPALSLGGTEGADKGGFGFNPPPYGLQRPWAVASDDNTGSLQPQHQQRHIAYPSPSSTFFPHNFLHCGSNDASLVADGGCDQAHDQNNLMHHVHHGQAGVFEAEYFI